MFEPIQTWNFDVPLFRITLDARDSRLIRRRWKKNRCKIRVSAYKDIRLSNRTIQLQNLTFIDKRKIQTFRSYNLQNLVDCKLSGIDNSLICLIIFTTNEISKCRFLKSMIFKIQYINCTMNKFEKCDALWNCRVITKCMNFSLFLRYAKNVVLRMRSREGIEIERGKDKKKIARGWKRVNNDETVNNWVNKTFQGWNWVNKILISDVINL